MARTGRPSDFKQEFIEQVYKLSLLGLIDSELAVYFDVSEVTLNAWKKKYPEFLKSLKKGKEDADVDVVKSLFKRANGYEYEEKKITIQTDAGGKEIGKKQVEVYKKYMPPDPLSCFFWLKNRQPNKWREKQDMNVSLTVNSWDALEKEVAKEKKNGA